MAVTAIFGINGVGKDTVAEGIRNSHSDITITSMSRLLMYILGITESFDVREKAGESQYRKLESVSQEKMIQIENEEYKYLLQELSKNDKAVIILAHLISALRHGNKINYLVDRKTPDWFIDLNEHLVQLIAPANIISERRFSDKTRNRDTDIRQILEHQYLCDKEWERIGNRGVLVKKKMLIVENINLDTTVEMIEHAIF